MSKEMISDGDRVQVKPGSDSAKLIIGAAPTGIVQSVDVDQVIILLDSSETVWSLALHDWVVRE